MTVVVVAGGNNDNRFAVIDFSVPGSPTQVLATPAFTGGCWVDCAGTLAAAANFNGGQVSIFDISNPALPTLRGTDATILGGISAISFDGSHVLVGELNGQRVALIDVGNPVGSHHGLHLHYRDLEHLVDFAQGNFGGRLRAE